MLERKIMNKIQIAISGFGARLFRNQVGTYRLEDGRVLSSGLGPGSSDLIGWHSIVVTQDMVGKRLALFTAIEVKSAKGKVSERQENFIKVVKRSGGVAFVARSTAEAVDKLFKESHIANGTGY